jgi:hypothetical protein
MDGSVGSRGDFVVGVIPSLDIKGGGWRVRREEKEEGEEEEEEEEILPYFVRPVHPLQLYCQALVREPLLIQPTWPSVRPP